MSTNLDRFLKQKSEEVFKFQDREFKVPLNLETLLKIEQINSNSESTNTEKVKLVIEKIFTNEESDFLLKNLKVTGCAFMVEKILNEFMGDEKK